VRLAGYLPATHYPLLTTRYSHGSLACRSSLTEPKSIERKRPGGVRQILTLSFTASEALRTGEGFKDATELLVEGRLKRVSAQADRFAELHPTRAFVSKIEVKPIKGEVGV